MATMICTVCCMVSVDCSERQCMDRMDIDDNGFPTPTQQTQGARTSTGSELVSPDGRRHYDDEGVRKAVRDFLVAIGENPDREGLLDTPDRIARAGKELFGGLYQSPKEPLSRRFKTDTDEMVLVRNIELYSVCEHHLMPFLGVAHIAYIPSNGMVVGLSKLARLVEVYARRPQVQERLTKQIADALMEELDARGCLVVIDCEHLCMSMRGIKKSQARTTTSAVRGIMKNAATCAEAMQLICRE